MAELALKEPRRRRAVVPERMKSNRARHQENPTAAKHVVTASQSPFFRCEIAILTGVGRLWPCLISMREATDSSACTDSLDDAAEPLQDE